MTQYRANFTYPIVLSIEVEADSLENAETKGWEKLEKMWNDDQDFASIIDQLKGAIGDFVAFDDIDLFDVEEA